MADLNDERLRIQERKTEGWRFSFVFFFFFVFTAKEFQLYCGTNEEITCEFQVYLLNEMDAIILIELTVVYPFFLINVICSCAGSKRS